MLDQPYARRAQRRAVDVPCEVVSGRWDAPVGHRVTDLTPFGAWVRSSFPLPKGERIVLSFTTPRGRELTVFAEVKRADSRRDVTRPAGMALEFIGMSRRERHLLARSLWNKPARRVYF